MRASRLRLVVLCAALLSGAGVAMARASVPDLTELSRTALVPSATPALLGPVDAAGRNGWKCLPEQAAKSPSTSTAELPQDPG
jgi:hypothetical protein